MSYRILIAGACPDTAACLFPPDQFQLTYGPATGGFDLFVLDSIEILPSLRHAHPDTPILVAMARYDAGLAVDALRMGADECVAWDCDAREIQARVAALLRRTARCRAASLSLFEFGGVSVDFAKGIVRREGRIIAVSRKELDLLRYLVARRGAVAPRRELLQEVWGYQSTATRTIDVHLACLRQKLERNPKSPQYLITIRGEGYLFRANVNETLPSRP
jgi:two-component system alkaline phosphatase synthesis response regulator PhoP